MFHLSFPLRDSCKRMEHFSIVRKLIIVYIKIKICPHALTSLLTSTIYSPIQIFIMCNNNILHCSRFVFLSCLFAAAHSSVCNSRELLHGGCKEQRLNASLVKKRHTLCVERWKSTIMIRSVIPNLLCKNRQRPVTQPLRDEQAKH